MSSSTQGSLEYIIIIGGVIILAAATYFMLRGFSQTTGEGTTETIGVAGDEFRLEMENLGRSETRFMVPKWGSLPYLSTLALNNTGGHLWNFTTEDLIYYSFPAIADLNGNGRLEILFGSEDSYFYCLEVE